MVISGNQLDCGCLNLFFSCRFCVTSIIEISSFCWVIFVELIWVSVVLLWLPLLFSFISSCIIFILPLLNKRIYLVCVCMYAKVTQIYLDYVLKENICTCAYAIQLVLTPSSLICILTSFQLVKLLEGHLSLEGLMWLGPKVST